MSIDQRERARDAPQATSRPQGTTPPARQRSAERFHHRLFVTPSVLVLLVLALYPLLFITAAALSRSSLGQPFQEFTGLQNLRAAAGDPAVQDSMVLGVGYGLGVAAASTVLGTATAVALWRSVSSGAVLRTLLLLPMIVPPVIVGILFSFIFSPSGGLIDTLLRQFTSFSGSFAVLSDPSWAIIGVAAADVWEWTPLVVLLVFTALLGQDPEILEAAQLDGAQPVQQFFHVTLPTIAGTVAAAFLIRLILAFKVFDLVYVMTSGGPGSSTQVPAYLIWRAALQNFDVGMAAAITLVLAVVVTLVTLPIFYLTKRLRDD